VRIQLLTHNVANRVIGSTTTHSSSMRKIFCSSKIICSSYEYSYFFTIRKDLNNRYNNRQPKYEYNTLLRRHGYDKHTSEHMFPISIRNEAEVNVWYPECISNMQLDQQINCYICTSCRTILETSSGDEPLHEGSVLKVLNDLYASNSVGPALISIAPSDELEGEQIGEHVYQTAEGVVREGRTKDCRTKKAELNLQPLW
jgi:hypothetical protein